jgi:ribosomal protein L19E
MRPTSDPGGDSSSETLSPARMRAQVKQQRQAPGVAGVPGRGGKRHAASDRKGPRGADDHETQVWMKPGARLRDGLRRVRKDGRQNATATKTEKCYALAHHPSSNMFFVPAK